MLADVSSACAALTDGNFSVNALDVVVSAAYNPTHPNRALANTTLMRMQESLDLWTKAGEIIEQSKVDQSRFFALSILDVAIKTRWKVMPQEERLGIRNFVVNNIIGISQDEVLLRKERLYRGKLNLTLVEILKQEWPHNWPSFISDLVGASKTSEALCENNMQILKLLSEEVFDFSRDEMVTGKVKRMKESLNTEFAQIFSLCEFVLGSSQQPSLLTATLQTMQRFLTWIPLGYIFQTNMIEVLIDKFFASPIFRNDALDCLTEIGSLKKLDQQYDQAFRNMFAGVLTRLGEMFSPDSNLQKAYENGSEEDQLFIRRLALFLSGFFKSHLKTMETPHSEQPLVTGLLYLVRVSEVKDTEIFRICLEAWRMLAEDLYKSGRKEGPNGSMITNDTTPRLTLYNPVLNGARRAMIASMAKPEEVLIVEDEDGDIVRETAQDTDITAQYKTMRETLVYLTHLSSSDTETIMLERLSEQMNSATWTWNGLSTVSWAIGSISGAMGKDEETRFLVTVLKDLLGLIEKVRGKDNKAVVASNIMYVVGQYPRFLKAHWKFLKTVVKKLFEFMREPFAGVQDMACDTFLKITTKCKRSFADAQGNDPPYIYELVTTLPKIISLLSPQQVQSFYEATAMILSDRGPPNGKPHIDRPQMLVRLMELPNSVWENIMTNATLNVESLVDPPTIKEVIKILKTNNRVCIAVGSLFTLQLQKSLMDTLNVYKVYSGRISAAIAQNGAVATQHSLVRTMRTAKKEVLRLLVVFVENSGPPEAEPQSLAEAFVPPILEAILPDYCRSIPDARDAEVLTLFTTIVTKLHDHVSSTIPRIMDAVLEVTLEMITKNFEDFPEHRLTFFEFLYAVNHHAFESLFRMRAEHQDLVVKAIVWAIQHTERNISDTVSMLSHTSRSVITHILIALIHRAYKSCTVSSQMLRKLQALPRDSTSNTISHLCRTYWLC